MTVLAAVCTKVPDGRLAIIFLPMFTFTAGNVSIERGWLSVCILWAELGMSASNCIILLSVTGFQALKAIIAMDTAGMILGWKFFDHAAHLGGALFGM